MNYSVKSERNFEVDVFVPSCSLAFEYNGEYHYQFVALYHQVVWLHEDREIEWNTIE